MHFFGSPATPISTIWIALPPPELHIPNDQRLKVPSRKIKSGFPSHERRLKKSLFRRVAATDSRRRSSPLRGSPLFGSQCRRQLSAAATCLKSLLLQLAENKENFLNEMHRKLFSAEVADGIVEERLLKTVVHYVLEEIALVTLCVAHLAENLAVATHDTLDCIV